MASILILGDFIFQEMELPEKIPFGGEQRLSVKKFIGGARNVQSLGPDPIALSWSGIILPLFDGTPSLMRAKYLNQMKDAGYPLILVWDELIYLVVIKSFVADYKFYQIPYTITCEVVEDLSIPALGSSYLSVGAALLADLAVSSGLADTVASALNDSVLGGLMADVSSAISSVSNWASASLSVVAQALVPINAASAYVSGLIGSTEATILSTVSPFGALAGAVSATAVAAVAGAVSATAVMPPLLGLSTTLGRMGRNLGLINSSVRTVTMAGGHLFDLAAQEYGDATAWTVIAQANNLTDPVITGTQTLVIPSMSSDSGGILQA